MLLTDRAGDRAQHEAMRGVFILMVMLDHNDLFRSVRDVHVFFMIMTYHVLGFMFLSLQASTPSVHRVLVARAPRYLVPFVLNVLLCWCAFSILVVAHGGIRAMPGPVALLTALIDATPSTLKPVTGYIFQWFLPALLALTLLQALLAQGGPIRRNSILLACIAVHLCIGAVPINIKDSVPFGILIAAYVLPLALLARRLTRLLDGLPSAGVATAAAAAFIASVRWLYGEAWSIPSLSTPTIFEPAHLIIMDSMGVSFFVLVCACSAVLARVRVLRWLGRYSLMVYLTHPLVYQAMFLVLLPVLRPAHLDSATGWASYVGLTTASITVAAGVGLAVGRAVDKSSLLRQLISPRDATDWLPLRLAHSRSSVS